MPRVLRTGPARADLLDIWIYVAEQNPAAARQLLKDVNDAAQSHAGFPQSGRARPECGQDLRSFVVRGYVVFYRPLPDGIQILRVLHGSRDVEAIFQEA